MRWRTLSRSASSTASCSRRAACRCSAALSAAAACSCACWFVEQRAAQPLDLGGERRALRVDLGQLPLQAAPLPADHAQLELAQLRDQSLVDLGLLGLALEILGLALDLAQDVVHARQVLARALHLALGGELAAAVQGRPRRLLDEQAAVLRLGVDELLDPPLLDDRVGLAADAGAEKQLGDVLQPARACG